MTEEQYLELERAAETRSEFLDGEIFAMSGGTSNHSLLQSALNFELTLRLRDRPCLVYTADMKVKVSSTGLWTYPDVSVVCGKPVFADGHRDGYLNPIVIAEVLSPSTERYDRGKKFHHYQAIASLQDYILVSQDAVLVEHYSRQENAWTLRTYSRLEDELRLDSIGVAVPLNEIYRRVEFTTE